MEKFAGLINEVQLGKLLNETMDDQLSYRKRMSVDMSPMRALSIGKPKYASIYHYKNNRVTRCHHRNRKLHDGGMCRTCFVAYKRTKLNQRIMLSLARQEED